MKKQNTQFHIAFLDFDDIYNQLLSGGQARATFEVARRLVKRGNSVTIICSRYPGSRDRIEEGITYKHIGLGTKNIKINNIAYFFALPFAVMRLRADAIIEAFTAPISTCFSPWFTRTPVMGMPTMFEAPEFTKKYHLPFDKIEAFGCRQYKYFLAYSPLNKKKMESLNPKIITRVIPNGVSEEMFDVETHEGDYGAFIGRIDITQKGLDLLIEACLILKAKGINPKIKLAGNGPQEDESRLKKMIIDNGLSDSVSFIGRVDGEKKIKFLAESLYGMYPSRFEDFPLVPLEFAGLNKPLVCFDINGLKWVPETIAIKAKAFEATDLARALEEMITDSKKRSALRDAAKPFARQYGWNNIAIQYEQFCKDVVAYEAGLKTKEEII
ncbi:MAG: glycosyltransferase family 4 protein [Patescibacteria group bacterium]